MRRFGPSKSWKKKNNVLEKMSAVNTSRSKDVFFDSNDTVVIIPQGLLFGKSSPVSPNLICRRLP
jgi:hypothetical protein